MSTDVVASAESWHGTHAGYVRHRCRCDECREYNNARARDYYARKLAGKPSTPRRKAQMAEARRRSIERGLPDPNDPRHGTLTGHNSYGCRCTRCCAASRGYERRRRAAIKQAKAEQSC